MTKKTKNRVVPAFSSTNANDVVFDGVSAVLSRRKGGEWVGTMTELNSTLATTVGKKRSSFLPRSASALRVVVDRIASRLRKAGVRVKFGRTTDHMRTRFVVLSSVVSK